MYDNEIKPDYIVGDFDSVPRKLVEYYREELDVPVREFNPVKMHQTQRSLCAFALV